MGSSLVGSNLSPSVDISTNTAQPQPPSFAAPLIQRWQSISRLHRGLGLLVTLRLVIALLIMLNVLVMPPQMRRGWYLHHGGDQEIMFRLAQGIVQGHPTREVFGLGQPLVMALFIWLTRAHDYFGIVAPLVLMNGFLLGGLSVAILGLLTRHTTKDETTALWAAAIWAAAPLLVYLLFVSSWRWQGFFVPKIGWLNGLSDPPAAFFGLLSAMILARMLDQQVAPSRRQWMVLGLSLGAAVVFRVHLLFMVVFLVGYCLIVYGPKVLRWIGIGGFVAYLPQAVYNVAVFQTPVTTGYLSAAATSETTVSEVLTTLPFHPKHLLDLWALQIAPHPAMMVGLIVISAAVVMATISLWKRCGWKEVALLIGAPLAYLLPILTAWPVVLDPIRFALPAIPFLIAVVVFAFSGRMSRPGAP